MKILIMGLSGSGKSSLAKSVHQLLSPSSWINADILRSTHNDWDFSYDGRIRQAKRMISLANLDINEYVIIDMICPFKDMRNIINPDFIIWMDTIKSSKYKDTDDVFEEPKNYDLRIKDFNKINAQLIIDKIKLKYYKMYELD